MGEKKEEEVSKFELEYGKVCRVDVVSMTCTGYFNGSVRRLDLSQAKENDEKKIKLKNGVKKQRNKRGGEERKNGDDDDDDDDADDADEDFGRGEEVELLNSDHEMPIDMVKTQELDGWNSGTVMATSAVFPNGPIQLCSNVGASKDSSISPVAAMEWDVKLNMLRN